MGVGEAAQHGRKEGMKKGRYFETAELMDEAFLALLRRALGPSRCNMLKVAMRHSRGRMM